MTDEQKGDIVLPEQVSGWICCTFDLEAIEAQAKAKSEERRLAIISMDIRCLIEVFN